MLPPPAVSPGSSGTGEGLVTSKPISEMTAIEVGALVEDLTKDQDVAHTFRENEIDGSMLLLLSEKDLSIMAPKIGHRIRIMRRLGKLPSSPGFSASSPASTSSPGAASSALFGFSKRTPTHPKPLEEIMISQAEKRQRQLEVLTATGKVNADGSSTRKRAPGLYDSDDTQIRVKNRGGSQCVTILDRRTDSYISRSKCSRAADGEAFDAIVRRFNTGALTQLPENPEGDEEAVGNNNSPDQNKDEEDDNGAGSGDDYIPRGRL